MRAGAPESQRAESTTSHARLSRDRIADACIAVAEREGLEAATMRRLGDELGVDPTAVYRHFRDKDELLIAVADRLLAQALDGYAPSGDWRTDIVDLSMRARRVYLAHPTLAHVLATSPGPLPNNERIAEAVLEALVASGLDLRRAGMAFQVLENYTAGASTLDAEVGSEADAAWRSSFAMLPASTYPTLVATAPHLYLDDEAAFTFGLDLILDGLAGAARSSRRPGGKP